MIDFFYENHIIPCSEIFFDIYYNPPFLYSWISKRGVYNYIDDIFHTPKFFGLVYISRSQIIGACLGFISDYFEIKKYRIAELFVKRNFSGNGIGSEMIYYAQEYLKKYKITAIEISTDRNKKSFDFYSKNGFISSNDTIYMIKIIK